MTFRDLVDRYASIWRFVLLILIWGWAAWDYKVFMDLTIRGLIISGLFFALNIVVWVGFQTRAAIAALGLLMLVHGFIAHHKASLGFGGVAVLSALLPVGRYWSVDAWLKVRGVIADYVPAGTTPKQLLQTVKVPLSLILLAFMIGGPIYNQVFHHDDRNFLLWDMFHPVGENLVLVRFSTVEGQPVDYMSVLGHKLKRYEVRHNKKVLHDMRIVGMDQLAVVIQRMCRAVPSPENLRLKAQIATVAKGWQPVYTGQEPICKSDQSGVGA